MLEYKNGHIESAAIGSFKSKQIAYALRDKYIAIYRIIKIKRWYLKYLILNL